MPTTITAQSGAQIKQNTNIAVAGCTGGKGRSRIRVLRRRVVGHKLILTIQTFAAGRVSVKSKDLHTVFRRFGKPGKFKIRVPLARAGVKALQRHHRLKLHIRVGFVPKQKDESSSSTSTTATFR